MQKAVTLPGQYVVVEILELKVQVSRITSLLLETCNPAQLGESPPKTLFEKLQFSALKKLHSLNIAPAL